HDREAVLVYAQREGRIPRGRVQHHEHTAFRQAERDLPQLELRPDHVDYGRDRAIDALWIQVDVLIEELTRRVPDREGGLRMRRRDFLGQTAAAGTMWALSPAARILGANDRIRLGIIGAGASGQDLLNQLVKLNDPNAELVAAADVYTRRHDQVRE